MCIQFFRARGRQQSAWLGTRRHPGQHRGARPFLPTEGAAAHAARLSPTFSVASRSLSHGYHDASPHGPRRHNPHGDRTGAGSAAAHAARFRRFTDRGLAAAQPRLPWCQPPRAVTPDRTPDRSPDRPPPSPTQASVPLSIWHASPLALASRTRPSHSVPALGSRVSRLAHPTTHPTTRP